MFQDLAIRPDVNLNADPETLFGIEHNDVVNFFSRANGVSYIATFVKLPPAKRQVVYAAFKALEPPIQETGKNRRLVGRRADKAPSAAICFRSSTSQP